MSTQADRPPNIRHFAALAATVRHGSLSRAARAVNLSQPALTQAITGLETNLGATLFDRGPAGMAPTEAALLLAPRAEAAIAHIGSPRVTGTQLRAFLAVVRAGSYAAAAEATGISPASLHRAVADLSVALGQRLLDRRGRGLTLTSAGEKRARGFGLAMAELRAGLSEVAALQGKAGARIAVGAMPLSRARWLPETIVRFTAAHPQVAISVHEGSHAELVGPLRDGEIDMLLGALREDSLVEDLVQETCFEDCPMVVMRADHPVLTASNPVRAMLEHPWILPGINTPLRRFWEAMVRGIGEAVPPVQVECGSVIMVRQFLLTSDALTLLSPDQVNLELSTGVLAAMAPPASVRRTIGIASRVGWRPTAAQAAFLATLREVGSTI